jgi:hypothetical protein
VGDEDGDGADAGDECAVVAVIVAVAVGRGGDARGYGGFGCGGDEGRRWCLDAASDVSARMRVCPARQWDQTLVGETSVSRTPCFLVLPS